MQYKGIITNVSNIYCANTCWNWSSMNSMLANLQLLSRRLCIIMQGTLPIKLLHLLYSYAKCTTATDKRNMGMIIPLKKLLKAIMCVNLLTECMSGYDLCQVNWFNHRPSNTFDDPPSSVSEIHDPLYMWPPFPKKTMALHCKCSVLSL